MDDITIAGQSKDQPLYQQLYASLREAILSGSMKPGMQLPSTRALASKLNVSRNTVLNAYQQLLAEGYLESVGGGGTFVAKMLPETLLSSSHLAFNVKSQPVEPPAPQFSRHAQAQLLISQKNSERVEVIRRNPIPFSPEVPALDAFPYQLWSRMVARQARLIPSSLYRYQDWAGYRPLREAIAAHVAVSRQVQCSADQVIIVPGSQGALDLTARMLVNAEDAVWLEDPGYLGARGAFLGVGARIIPVPVDQEGLNVAEGIALEPNARMVYTTPSHQFPLGMTMSASRRLALLNWAKGAGAFIVEDDYDSEYRFAGRPLAALQGLDDAGRVIYIGTFSKVLFPALRLGYLILPPSLVDAFLSVRRFIDMHPPVLEQAVLTEFFVEGHFSRHLRRMRTLYAERRATLLDAARNLPVEIFSPEAGIHCVGWLPDGMNAPALVRVAADLQLDLTLVSSFSIRPMARQGLLLGYGGFREAEIRSGARRLSSAIQQV